MTKRLERDEEEEFVSYALTRGCRSWKLVRVGRKGMLDQTVLCPGARTLFIEFKRGKNDTSPHQDEYREMLQKLGYVTAKAYSFKEAKEILDAFLDAA